MAVVVLLALLSLVGAERARRSPGGRARWVVGHRGPRRWPWRWRPVLAMAVSLALATVARPLALLPWLIVAVGRLATPRRLRRRRRQQVVLGLPETVDLARIVVSSGATVSETVDVLARGAPEPYAAAFAAAATEVRQGVRLAEALPVVIKLVGDPARGLVRALLSGERDGVPVGPLLERVRVEALRVRRHELEVAARRLPVLLLFPLVLCVLPAFVLLTVVPLLASALQDLRV